MKILIHKNEDRGHADYGWLKTKYSFSFGDWYEPTRMGFGALRVINEDIVASNTGFPNHSHDNMEIITIVTSGSVSHEDSIGNRFDVNAGDIQVMSAGTGVTHSEKNNSDENLNLYQIWIEPKIRNIKPSYSQKQFSSLIRKDSLSLLVSSGGEDNSLKINQDAFIYMGNFEEENSIKYKIKKHGHGIYILLISGQISISGHDLGYGDAIGISEVDELEISIPQDTKFLLFEVPLKL